jgi:hypothetical protein
MGKRKESSGDEKDDHRSKATAKPDDPNGVGGHIAASTEVATKRPAEGTNATIKTEDAKKHWQRARDWFTRGNRPFTIVVAVSTAINVAVAFYQWRAMIRQNELIMDVAWLENRPWLILEKPTLESLVANRPLNVSIALENAGRTPAYIKKSAYNVNTISALGVVGLELPQKQVTDFQTNLLVNTIPPGKTIKGPLDKQHTLTEREVKQIEEGLLLLTFSADIVYSDGQKKVHLTRLILTYDVDRKRFVGNGNHSYMD